MPRMNMIGSHATSVENNDNYTQVKYHGTNVVYFDKDSIILNTGGWFTQTTKNRMNQASNVFNLKYKVFQKNYQWFINYKGKTIPFTDDKLIINKGL